MKFQLFLSLALIILTSDLNFVSSQRDIGDSCNHQATGKSGTCKLLSVCASAIAELQQQRLPQTCGFQGTQPIVCCPGQQTTPVNNIGGVVGAKSREKCKEYAKYVYTTYRPPTLVGGQVPNKTRNDCGFKVVKLIVGGTKAKGKEFPHMAAVGYEAADGTGRLYHCGGSLISEYFVLTAGHCYFSREHGAAKYVRVGDLNLKDEEDDADPQEFDIAEFIRHPDYKPPSQYNDIALIKITGKVRFTPYVRPVCLTTAKPSTESAIAIGWGKTGGFEEGSDDLLKVTLDFFTQQECYNTFEPNARKLKNGIVEASQICAGSKKDELKDTCPGDSGGPLQIYNLEEYCMYTLVGVTSFGKICGMSHSPAVYTRVSHYIDWIEKTAWP